MYKLNYEPQFQKLCSILNIWSQRDLTPIGKITIIKSLALSQLTYMFSILPCPPNDFIKKLENVLFKFIWNNKPDKIKRQVLYGTKENGGLKMTNIGHFIDALKIAWVKRYMHDENKGKWKTLFKNELSKFGENWVWSCKPSCDDDFDYSKISNTFLRDVLKSWFKLRNVCDEKCMDALWYNSDVKISNKTVYYGTWSTKGVNLVSDLIDNNHWISYEEFCNRYDIKCNFLKFFGVISAISGIYNDQLTEGKQTHDLKLLLDLQGAVKGSSFAYQLLNQGNVVPTSQPKWEEDFNTAGHEHNPIDWNKVYSTPYKCTIDVKSRYFQYRFIHRILPTMNVSMDGLRTKHLS